MVMTINKGDEEALNRRLYHAFMEGDEAEVIKLCGEVAEGPLHKMTIHMDTVIHVACDAKRNDLVLKLLETLPKDHDPRQLLTVKNDVENTILHEAATDSCMLPAAKEMLRKAPELLTEPNVYGEIPLFCAAKYGEKKMFKFLVGEVAKRGLKGEEHPEDFFWRKDETTILHVTILAEHFDLAKLIATRYSHLINLKDEDGMTALQLLACDSSTFKARSEYGFLKQFMFSCLSRKKEEDKTNQEDYDDESQTKVSSGSAKPCWRWPMLEEVRKKRAKYESACDLAKLLIRKDTSWKTTEAREAQGKLKNHKYGKQEKEDHGGESKLTPSMDQKKKGCSESSSTSTEKNHGVEVEREEVEEEEKEEKGDDSQDTYTARITPGETPLFLATMWGNIEIVEEILKAYPQALEHINKKGRNILHVAVKYSQKEIFELVMNKETLAKRLITRADQFGNTILHMAAKKKKSYLEENIKSPALQLRKELLLFERVKGISPTYYAKHLNKKKLTPEELFAATYARLQSQGKEWIKRTSENCTVVAVLIATVAFAAAYTVPGGHNEDTGRPVLLYESFFLVFTLTDVLSLTLALTSVVTFLSILTSSYRIQDFRHSLPQKLMLGLTLLILSVTMMMVAFGATIILMENNQEKWKQIGLYFAAFFPVTIFAISYSSLCLSLLSTVSHLLKIIWKASPRCDCAPLLSRVPKLFQPKSSAWTSKPQTTRSPEV